MEECQTSAIHSLPLRVWAGVLKSPLIDSLIMKVSLRTLYDMVNGTTWLLSYLLRLLDVSVPRLAGFSLITRSPYLLYLRYHLSGERGPDNALPSASRLCLGWFGYHPRTPVGRASAACGCGPSNATSSPSRV